MAEETLLLGMPQLCLAGLSEVWLLKELGHRHWMGLAQLAGRSVPDFRATDGAPVYAAFRALSVEQADFAVLGENDRLTIRTTLCRLTHTQCASRHELTCRGRPVGTVNLVSTFVRRAPRGGNHTVARVALEAFPKLMPPLMALGRAGESLAARAATFRSTGAAPEPRFAAAGLVEDGCVTFDPCPAQDFNGAGFLYFSSFIALIDRAEWHFDGRSAPQATTRRREVYFHGNIDPGERVVVRRLMDERGARERIHHYRLERAGDDLRLADAFTQRVF
ncbi:Pnap_2097 family protein [Ancylobacter sp.]|uniref:Pnap_2097 family protein n=1 Tax=Ancylobacter sp. TaxID=1872567 RepID=UPI003C7D73DD